MPIYEFKCPTCGARYHFMDRDHLDDRCVNCNTHLKRVFSFAIRPTMPDHFNNSTNTYVRNESHFRDELKRLSEEATEYTGIEHDYKPVDWRDKETIGVTEEGLDDTYDRAKEDGRPALDPSTI